MNCRRTVTITMFWMEETETITAWMTVFSPLALWMALRGLSTLNTLRIFRTETSPATPAKRMEMRETPTTSMSSRLAAERMYPPFCTAP